MQVFLVTLGSKSFNCQCYTYYKKYSAYDVFIYLSHISHWFKRFQWLIAGCGNTGYFGRIIIFDCNIYSIAISIQIFGWNIKTASVFLPVIWITEFQLCIIRIITCFPWNYLCPDTARWFLWYIFCPVKSIIKSRSRCCRKLS